MNLFGKRRQTVLDRGDLGARLEALERHQDYLQERIEYAFRQMKKQLPDGGDGKEG